MLSRSHPLARRLRALRTDGGLRAAEGVVVAEGIHLAFEALRSFVAIEAAVVSPRLLDSEQGRDLARRLTSRNVPTHEASSSTLDALQDARAPQPVVLIVRRPPVPFEEALTGRGGTPLLVVACGVQDPGNLGALLRTAEAAGGTGLASSEGSAGLTHPRTVRASMGAIFRLPAAEASLTTVLERAHDARFRVMGAVARGGTDYDAVDWEGPVAVLFGGEGAGLPPEAEAALAVRVSIPMARGAESLSVNAAAAVLLFDAARRRLPINRA